MPSLSNFNKIKIVTLAQRGMSQAEISMDLRIPKSTISSIPQILRNGDKMELLKDAKTQGGLGHLLQKKIICFSIDYAIVLL
jgi:transcriptional regulator with XRE-family HTH domain